MTVVRTAAAFAAVLLSCSMTVVSAPLDASVDAGLEVGGVASEVVDLWATPDPCVRFETGSLDIDGKRVSYRIALPCDRTSSLRDLGDPLP